MWGHNFETTSGEVRRTTEVACNAVHDGLYVIDCSIIPRSLGVNPLFTITALSERALAHMLADRRLSANARPPLSKPIPANTPSAIMAAE